MKFLIFRLVFASIAREIDTNKMSNSFAAWACGIYLTYTGFKMFEEQWVLVFLCEVNL